VTRDVQRATRDVLLCPSPVCVCVTRDTRRHALTRMRRPHIRQPMPVAAVDPKEVGGVEGVDEGGVEHELRLQVVQEVVSKGWLRRVEEG